MNPMNPGGVGMAGALNRARNEGLVRLLEQARLSETQLALQVNRLGEEAGLPLRYSQSTVAQWKRGAQPRAQVRPLIIEAFERKLGRPVTFEEAGLAPEDIIGGAKAGDTVEDLVSLGRAVMDPSRRGLLKSGLYSAALSVPLFSEIAYADTPRPPTRPTGRIGQGEVETVRRMTDRIADILDDLGGGHALPMSAAFLVNTVAGYLRAAATDSVHRSMLSAASDLAYLTGWMAMYERQHGLGQTYYLQALKLAGESQDHITYCRTLRGMSLQATNLRHGRKALELADSAAEAAPKAGPRLVAFLRGQQAHASAMTHDSSTAFKRLREAEQALSRADSRRESIGGYDAAAFQFHVAHVLYETRDLPGSIRAMKTAIRLQPEQERQGRLHFHAVLAQRQWELGHLEEACSSWERFLDDYALLSTARGDEHFETLIRRTRSYSTMPTVRRLRERGAEVSALKGCGPRS